jgi:HNH endonuclease
MKAKINSLLGPITTATNIMTNTRPVPSLAAFPVRFQKKVRIDTATGCWIWTGTTKHAPRHPEHKYPVYAVDATPESCIGAHQFAYEFAFGALLRGLRLDVDHVCTLKLCVNPAHLRPLTHQDNCKLRGKRSRVPGSVRWHKEQEAP